MHRRHRVALLGALVGSALALSGLPAGAATGGLAPSAVTGATTLTPSATPPGAVPAQYQALYDEIGEQVQGFAASVGPVRAHPATTFGVELLAANGNIGSGLLAAKALAGVEEELDAFRALGVRGVTVDVSFPLLVPSTPDSAAYLAFYERVAAQIHKRGMVFSVEENPVFAGTPLTTLAVSYAGLTLASYAAEQRQQAQLIINDLRPAYLSVLTEPDTYTSVLGITLDTPATATEVVHDELHGLARHHTMVGAGAGNWSNPAIDGALVAHTSIDYLDVHVFPFAARDLANLATDVAAAKRSHLPLVMDETWLNKPIPGAPSGVAGAPGALQEKSYSFWEPLDEEYVAAMVSYARSEGFAYVSFFDGARAFFGYLTWSPELQAAGYRSFSAQYNQLVAESMRTLTVSGTGLALHRALSG